MHKVRHRGRANGKQHNACMFDVFDNENIDLQLVHVWYVSPIYKLQTIYVGQYLNNLQKTFQHSC